MKFEIVVTSAPDRKNLVSEIWHNHVLVAEINTETSEQAITFYCEKASVFDFDDLVNALAEAASKLKGDGL